MITSILIRSRILTLSVLMAIVATVLIPATASAIQPSSAKAAKPGNQTIAEIAIGNSNFSTLVTALSCEGLVGALSGDRQLTVFAPTNDAFSQLGLDSSNVCNQPGLTNILLYHVMSGRQTSTSVLARNSYKMLNGDKLTQSKLVGAGIATTDISASNGIVHVINNVLLP